MKLNKFEPALLKSTPIGVYAIFNSNGEVYIGSSRELHLRLKKYTSVSHILPSQILKSLLTYGVQNHYIFILELCDNTITKQELLDLEDRYILDYIKTQGEHTILNQRTNKKHVWVSPNYKKYASKLYTKIEQLSMKGQLIKTYDSITEAVKELGKTNNGLISNCINGKIEHVYGFRWRKVIESGDIS